MSDTLLKLKDAMKAIPLEWTFTGFEGSEKAQGFVSIQGSEYSVIQFCWWSPNQFELAFKGAFISLSADELHRLIKGDDDELIEGLINQAYVEHTWQDAAELERWSQLD